MAVISTPWWTPASTCSVFFGFIIALGIIDDAIIMGESAYSEQELHGHSVQSVVTGVSGLPGHLRRTHHYRRLCADTVLSACFRRVGGLRHGGGVVPGLLAGGIQVDITCAPGLAARHKIPCYSRSTGCNSAAMRLAAIC